MSGIGKRIEDLLSAISFAEEGEFETARELARKKGKILLVLSGSPSDKLLLKYAANTAKRIGASLDILCVRTGEGEPSLPDGFAEGLEKEGIRCDVAVSKGCMRKAVVEAAGRRRDILFTVIESSEVFDLDCTEDERKMSAESLRKRLGCPLVVVSQQI